MATVKKKSKKKVQDWEKELERLLNKLDKLKTREARINTAKAVRNVYYKHYRKEYANNLNESLVTRAKAAEAERQGARRVNQGTVKKSKYQPKYTQADREAMKIARNQRKNAKKAEKRKQERANAKKEWEEKERKYYENKAKEGAAHILAEGFKKTMLPPPELSEEILKEIEEQENSFIRQLVNTGNIDNYKIKSLQDVLNYVKDDERSVLSDIKDATYTVLDGVQKIRNLRSKLHQANEAGEETSDIYLEIQREEERLKNILESAKADLETKRKLQEQIAIYKGMDIRQKSGSNELSDYFKNVLRGQEDFQVMWLIETYEANGKGGSYYHTDKTKDAADAVADGLSKIMLIMQNKNLEISEEIYQDYRAFLSELTDLTIFSIQYDQWISSEGIAEAKEVVEPYSSGLQQMRKEKALMYHGGVIEYENNWSSFMENQDIIDSMRW